MLVENVFEEIFTGYNINNSITDDKYINDLYTMQKDSIQYSNIIESKLIKKRFSGNIKRKYYMHDRDIIIFVKKPYRVGTYRFNKKLDIIIPNNFIVLRGINMDLYSYIFVTNYLEKIGIQEFVEKNNITGNLSIEDIKKIKLPSISKDKQMKISKLINAINERSSIYSTILENDDKIVKYALNKVVGDSDDR